MTDQELILNTRAEGESLVVELGGSLDTGTSPILSRELSALAADGARGRRLVLDLAALTYVDSAGVAVILDARERFAQEGIDLRLRGASERVRRVFALALARADELVPEAPAQFWDPVGAAGEAALRLKEQARDTVVQVGEVSHAMLVAPFHGQPIRLADTVHQLLLIGVNAMPIVSLIALLMGLILGMQSAHQLRQFGASLFIADLVGVATTRELGPLITAIVVAGRSGSAIAAEIGTMVVTEEIDALRTMGLHPIRYLFVPRILAVTVAVPLLSVMANTIAILGGLLIGVVHLGIGPQTYFDRTVQALVMDDVVTGLVKAMVFGVIIGNVGVYEGYHVRGGAEGVGRATTQSVVSAIFLIIVADAVFTAIFYFV
jgi:phospholipid/cholesterol/gamma-HCH transport system permease protein